MNSGVTVFRMTGFIVAVLVVAGCASGPQTQPADMHRAPLLGSNKALPGTHYDKSTGLCSSGVQLLDKAAFDVLVSEWTAQSQASCKTPLRSQTPSKASYPDAFAKKSGSAEVLVRIESNGTVESVHAVCATDADFARAAEETAKAIGYAPATCDGVATRSVFLLPFHYDNK